MVEYPRKVPCMGPYYNATTTPPGGRNCTRRAIASRWSMTCWPWRPGSVQWWTWATSSTERHDCHCALGCVGFLTLLRVFGWGGSGHRETWYSIYSTEVVSNAPEAHHAYQCSSALQSTPHRRTDVTLELGKCNLPWLTVKISLLTQINMPHGLVSSTASSFRQFTEPNRDNARKKPSPGNNTTFCLNLLLRFWQFKPLSHFREPPLVHLYPSLPSNQYFERHDLGPVSRVARRPPLEGITSCLIWILAFTFWF